MRRVFVYEYLTGGGMDGGDAAAVEALMPLGRSMRDALAIDLLAGRRCSVTVAATARAGLPAGQLSSALVVAPQVGESAVDFVARQAASHDAAWVVAPETAGVLVQLQRAVGTPRWLGCSAAAIELAASKRATLLRLAGRGVLTPLAFEHVADVARWVVKPDDGAGGVATRVHARRDAAWADGATRARGGVAMTIEPWVDGDALSLSLLCRAGTAELLSINRQRIDVDDSGRLAFAGVQLEALPAAHLHGAALQALASQVAASIRGLEGFVGIDLVWHAVRGPVVIEVNPRVTCAYVGLSAALGRNLAVELLGHWEQRLHSDHPAGGVRVGA